LWLLVVVVAAVRFKTTWVAVLAVLVVLGRELD
jgi:hypothetical protein